MTTDGRLSTCAVCSSTIEHTESGWLHFVSGSAHRPEPDDGAVSPPDEDDEHELRITRRRLGAAPLAHINGAAGVRYGTNASCSCGDWSSYTNDLPPSRGGRKWAKDAHAGHVAEMGEDDEAERALDEDADAYHERMRD